jgi:thiamine biosynthesis lipoprotein
MNRVKRCRPLLGTYVEITLTDKRDTEWLHQTINKAFYLIETVQRMMSFHDPASDISRLNRCGHLAPLAVHPWTLQVLKKAVTLSEETGGAFDVTLAPRLVAAGLLPRHGRQHQLAEAGRWQDIAFPAGESSLVAFHRPLKIDLGGIAKGFAVDKAIDYLASKGVSEAVVNAGGDLRMHGSSQLRVDIRHPQYPQQETIPSVMLRPAVATSAAYFVKQRMSFIKAHHIIHPHTGQPLKTNQSVSVFSPTCVVADALTKAVLIAPQTLWNKVLASYDSFALFITRRGEQVLYPS